MWGLSLAAVLATLTLSALTLLLLAAIVTPTDPVFAQAITTSEIAEEKVPEDVRHLISADSAGNDGLAFLFVTTAIWMVAGARELGLAHFAYLVLAIAGGPGGRRAFGWAMGRLMVSVVGNWGAGQPAQRDDRPGVRHRHRPEAARHGWPVWRVRRRARAERGDRRGTSGATDDFNHALAELFQLPLLVLLGMTLPFDDWYRLGWPLFFAVFCCC